MVMTEELTKGVLADARRFAFLATVQDIWLEAPGTPDEQRLVGRRPFWYLTFKHPNGSFAGACGDSLAEAVDRAINVSQMEKWPPECDK